MSSSERPFSRRAWKARNWSSGCSGARWMFSASESSSPRMSVAGIADHARNRRGLRQALLLHQQLERPVAAAAGRDLEHAGLGALGVEDRPDVEALEQRAPGDVLGQLLDRDAGLHAPDVGLAQHQLVEGNVARGRQGDLLNGSSHGGSLRGGRPRDSLSTSNPPRNRRSPLPLGGPRRDADEPEELKAGTPPSRFSGFQGGHIPHITRPPALCGA